MTDRPAINTKDVQGLFKGFGLHWPHGCFFYCRYDDDAAGRRLLQRLCPLTSFSELASRPEVCVNAALTFPGLAALRLEDDLLRSLPDDFTDGMRHRAGINGDVEQSDPSRWEETWQEARVHIWIGVYARTAAHLDAWIETFTDWVDQSTGVSIVARQPVGRIIADEEKPVYIDDPASQPVEPVLLEHFGFRDGMGNPAIAGLVDKHVAGAGALDPQGQWHPLPTGEFLLGHIDSNGELPIAPRPPAFANNGSFMVLRKLEQDVDSFRDYLKKLGKKLDRSADDIAARMVGRRRDGRPLLSSHGDYDFRYAGDPEGRQCPLGAHIRRANPRDAFGAEFGSLLVDRHRILRRAITYGQLVERDQTQKDVNGADGQGLIFIVLNASIARQFEFVQQQWINYGNDFNQGNDRDPITGSPADGGQMVIPGTNERPTMICDELKQFVRCRGGDYFFLPSISAFEALGCDERGWQREG